MRIISSIALLFFLWRVLLFMPLLAGYVFLPYRAGFEFTHLWNFIHPYAPVSNFLLFPWANFDGIYYLSIAGNGYTVDTAGFFPLYPFLIHIFSFLMGSFKTYGLMQFFVAFFLANVFFFVSLIVFYYLLRFDYEKRIAIKVIIFLLIFPTSFYFASIYSESLFLFLALCSFYFARKKRWVIASFFAMLLAATRIVGIGILPALVVELYLQEGTIKKKQIASFLLIPMGLISYMLFNFFNWQNAIHFLSAHGTIHNGRSTDTIVLFPQTVFRYIKILMSVSPSVYEWWIALLEIGTFLFVCIALYMAWKKKVRFSYILFSFLCFAVPISSGTLSGLPRYAVILFPIYIVMSLLDKKVWQYIYVIVSIILLFLLLLLFSRGYYVA